MHAAVDLHAAPASTSLGLKHTVAVFAAVPGVGVAHLVWKDTVRLMVPPGDHVVVIWAKLVRKAHQGISHARVHLEPGQAVGLRWKMPDTVFGVGAIVPGAEAPTRLAYVEDLPLPAEPGPCRLWPPHPVVSLDPIDPAAASAPAVAAPVVAAPPAGAWHADPTGRYPYRWWDGQRWTELASNGDVTFPDPVPGL